MSSESTVSLLIAVLLLRIVGQRFYGVPPGSSAGPRVFYCSRQERPESSRMIRSLSILEGECVFDHALAVPRLYEVLRVLMYRVMDEHERRSGGS